MRLTWTVRARRTWKRVTVVAVAGASVALALLAASREPAEPVEREIQIVARQYSYEPHRIVVNAGDKVRLRLASQDVVHGFFLEGHDLEAEIRPGQLAFRLRNPSADGEGFQEVEEAVFTARRPGKYRYRCSVTCGTLHPFMQGELVVRPNLPFRAGVAGTCAVTVATLGLVFSRRRWPRAGPSARRRSTWRLDLLARFPRLARLVTWRGFPFAVILPNVLVFSFFIVAGLFGSPIGNRNVIVTVVWILWWFLLIVVMVPLGGRLWCLMCPLPFFGEWLARRRLVSVEPEAEGSRPSPSEGGRRKWPKRLSGMWIQNLLFLALCTFSTILVTRPALTAAVLGGMVVAAVGVHALYRRRSFCRYLCPLNAWMSVYAMTAMTEVRARDPELCRSCRRHSCATGTRRAWSCPWLIKNPSRLDRNNYCGLCMECVKACPQGNLTLRARPFCSDVAIRGYDEAWMALIMITLVVAYTVTLLGPWGRVKLWANVTEVGNWAGFGLLAAVIWLTALVALPGLWYALAWLGRRLAGAGAGPGDVPARELFLRYSYLLVPLGLLAWTAFSFPLIMVNYTHVTASLSDPMGWGWDLFGAADQPWRPLWPEAIPYLQIPLLLFGLATALVRGAAIAGELFPARSAALRSLLPHAALCAAITLLLLRLFVG